LVGNWYVSRNEAQRHLKRIVSLGEKKETKLESDVEDEAEE